MLWEVHEGGMKIPKWMITVELFEGYVDEKTFKKVNFSPVALDRNQSH
jgi:hypothetical protein